MAKRSTVDDKPEVPMSAMIDIVFLLLVYFILTFKIEPVEAHMSVNMPSPSRPPPEDVPKPQLLEVHILPEGYLLRGRSVSLDTLEETLASMASYDQDQTVIIKVSLKAQQVQLVQLLDSCKKVGLEKLNVLTLKY